MIDTRHVAEIWQLLSEKKKMKRENCQKWYFVFLPMLTFFLIDEDILMKLDITSLQKYKPCKSDISKVSQDARQRQFWCYLICKYNIASWNAIFIVRVLGSCSVGISDHEKVRDVKFEEIIGICRIRPVLRVNRSTSTSWRGEDQGRGLFQFGSESRSTCMMSGLFFFLFTCLFKTNTTLLVYIVLLLIYRVSWSSSAIEEFKCHLKKSQSSPPILVQ